MSATYKMYESTIGLIFDVGMVCGYGLLFITFLRLKKQAEMKATGGGGAQGQMTGIYIYLFCSIMLISAPTMLDMFKVSLVGSSSPLSYSTSDSVILQRYVQLQNLIRVFGVGMFIRAWILFSKCGHEQSQPGNLGKGFIWLVISLMAVNVGYTTDLIHQLIGAITSTG